MEIFGQIDEQNIILLLHKIKAHYIFHLFFSSNQRWSKNYLKFKLAFTIPLKIIFRRLL